jgi:hypothetical protein
MYDELIDNQAQQDQQRLAKVLQNRTKSPLNNYQLKNKNSNQLERVRSNKKMTKSEFGSELKSAVRPKTSGGK